MIQTYRADTKALPFATAIEMSGELDLPETVYGFISERVLLPHVIAEKGSGRLLRSNRKVRCTIKTANAGDTFNMLAKYS